MTPTQQLSLEAIRDFQAIYRDEFDEELSNDQALEMAIRLLRFFHILEKADNSSR